VAHPKRIEELIPKISTNLIIIGIIFTRNIRFFFLRGNLLPGVTHPTEQQIRCGIRHFLLPILWILRRRYFGKKLTVSAAALVFFETEKYTV